MSLAVFIMKDSASKYDSRGKYGSCGHQTPVLEINRSASGWPAEYGTGCLLSTNPFVCGQIATGVRDLGRSDHFNLGDSVL